MPKHVQNYTTVATNCLEKYTCLKYRGRINVMLRLHDKALAIIIISLTFPEKRQKYSKNKNNGD